MIADLSRWRKFSGRCIVRTTSSGLTLIKQRRLLNSPELAMLYDKEKQKGNANRAALAVTRKMVAYLMAVDRGQRNFHAVTSNIAA